MKPKAVVGFVALIVSTLALALPWTNNAWRKEASSRMQSTEVRARAKKIDTTPSTESAAVNNKRTKVEEGYLSKLAQAKNYADFAAQAYPAAAAGNRDAQFALGKSLAFCDESYAALFVQAGRRLSIDEALQRAAQLHRPSGLVQKIFDRCHDLKDGNADRFGTAVDWIERSAAAGQPAAAATRALAELSKQFVQMTGRIQPDARVDSPGEEDPVDLRRTILDAVKSGDPETLWKAGAAQGLLTQVPEEKLTNQFAWWLVSCERGFDCKAGADWIVLDCQDDRYCSPSASGLDYIRNGAGDKWPEVERRALEINQALDAKNWSALGLGS